MSEIARRYCRFNYIIQVSQWRNFNNKPTQNYVQLLVIPNVKYNFHHFYYSNTHEILRAYTFVAIIASIEPDSSMSQGSANDTLAKSESGIAYSTLPALSYFTMRNEKLVAVLKV